MHNHIIESFHNMKYYGRYKEFLFLHSYFSNIFYFIKVSLKVYGQFAMQIYFHALEH